MEHERDDYTNCNWCFWYSRQRISTRSGGHGNYKTSRDHPNYCIIEIGQNTEKSPGDLRVLVTQSPVKKPSANVGVKNSQKRTTNNNNNNNNNNNLEWVGEVLHWEMCEKLKFDYTNKLYMHNLESDEENKMHKLLWDF